MLKYDLSERELILGLDFVWDLVVVTVCLGGVKCLDGGVGDFADVECVGGVESFWGVICLVSVGCLASALEVLVVHLLFWWVISVNDCLKWEVSLELDRVRILLYTDL